MYFEFFTNEDSILSNFSIPRINGTILVAYYNYEEYSGEAFVLFESEGQLYEVNASHCSCNGLEEQWMPELCYAPELYQRVKNMKNRFSFFNHPKIKASILDAILNFLPVELQEEAVFELDEWIGS